MSHEPSETANGTGPGVLPSVLLFWMGYVAITLAVGLVTSSTIRSEVGQITAWGLLSSAGLLALTRLLMKIESKPATVLGLAVGPSSLGRFALGLLVGVAAFGVHLAVVTTVAGPVRFEWASGAGVLVAVLYFARFVATSCMEELGFRGYALQRLTARTGAWPAVCLTAVAFGLSHLLYGWDLQTIALGVVPGGLLWGMSALATRSLAVPIGLHAAWNFASWWAGNRAEPGVLRMTVEDSALERTRAVGATSYVAISVALTVGFWILYRRNSGRASPTEPGS